MTRCHSANGKHGLDAGVGRGTPIKFVFFECGLLFYIHRYQSWTSDSIDIMSGIMEHAGYSTLGLVFEWAMNYVNMSVFETIRLITKQLIIIIHNFTHY